MAKPDTQYLISDADTSPPRPMQSRQPRAMETRLRLMRAGREAFGRLGHDGVNLTRDILQPAGVSVGSFYHQFEDKTELLLEILGSAAAARRSAVLGLTLSARAALDEPDTDVWLANIYDLFFDSLDEDSHGWRLQLRERSSGNPRIRQVVASGRVAWIAQVADLLARRFATDPDESRIAATILVAHGIGIATLYLDRAMELSVKEHSRLRKELIDGAVAFASGGLTYSLGLSSGD